MAWNRSNWNSKSMERATFTVTGLRYGSPSSVLRKALCLDPRIILKGLGSSSIPTRITVPVPRFRL